jgi:putative oxidoreductase
MNEGLLVARLVLGGMMAAHGAQKLFGWFGGYGLSAVSGYFETLGFRPGRFFAAVVIVAAVSVHWNHGLFATSNGIEVPLLYGAGAAALALTGPGFYSLDAALGLTGAWTPAVDEFVLAIGIAGGILNLWARRTQPAAVSA